MKGVGRKPNSSPRQPGTKGAVVKGYAKGRPIRPLTKDNKPSTGGSITGSGR
jgi:hypothetical protein